MLFKLYNFGAKLIRRYYIFDRFIINDSHFRYITIILIK